MNHYKKIQVFPSLDVRKLFTRRTHDDPILADPRVRFYASGRAALFHAISSLSLPTESVILVPAYNCGVEVEAVLRSGCSVVFFRVNSDLTIDLNHIAEKITSLTKAIVVPHYFGFPQDISGLKELTRNRNIVIIEDCAHALYSQDRNEAWLGKVGDFGLFSMRKTVSMPNGGAVLVNNPSLALPDKGKSYFNLSLVKESVKSILEYEKNRAGKNFNLSEELLAFYQKYISRSDGSGGTLTAENPRWYYDVPSLDYKNDISFVSRFCSEKEDSREIIASRRRNYEFLKKSLGAHCDEDYVVPELLPGTCPLCLPLFVKRRDATVSLMTANGVEPYIFGRHPHPLVNRNEFPELKALADSVIGLPVHQQLTQEDMETVADVFIRSRER